MKCSKTQNIVLVQCFTLLSCLLLVLHIKQYSQGTVVCSVVPSKPTVVIFIRHEWQDGRYNGQHRARTMANFHTFGCNTGQNRTQCVFANMYTE